LLVFFFLISILKQKPVLGKKELKHFKMSLKIILLILRQKTFFHFAFIFFDIILNNFSHPLFLK